RGLAGEVEHAHRPAVACERQGDGPADPATAAGDDRDPHRLHARGHGRREGAGHGRLALLVERHALAADARLTPSSCPRVTVPVQVMVSPGHTRVAKRTL